MSSPFTREEFLGVFARYNEAVGPVPLMLAGAAALGLLAVVRSRRAAPAMAILLAGLWAWSGAVYHLGFFRAVNPAATIFGSLFLVQAGLFALAGAGKGGLCFRPRRDVRGVVGGAVLLYALAAYPALVRALGEPYPGVPTFGAPCPVVLYTFGVLLWAGDPVPRWLLPIPLGWSLLGGSAAFAYGVLPDLGLLATGPLATVLLLGRQPPRRSANSRAIRRAARVRPGNASHAAR